MKSLVTYERYIKESIRNVNPKDITNMNIVRCSIFKLPIEHNDGIHSIRVCDIPKLYREMTEREKTTIDEQRKKDLHKEAQKRYANKKNSQKGNIHKAIEISINRASILEPPLNILTEVENLKVVNNSVKYAPQWQTIHPTKKPMQMTLEQIQRRYKPIQFGVLAQCMKIVQKKYKMIQNNQNKKMTLKGI